VNENDKGSAERLLSAQAQDPKLKLKYQQGMDALLNKKMPVRVRVVLAGVTGVVLWLAFILAVGVRHGMGDGDVLLEPMVIWLVLALAVACSLAWVTWRGRVLRANHGIFAAVIVGISALIATLFMRFDLIPMEPVEMHAHTEWLSTIIGVLGWVPLALLVNSHYHEKTREKLLEIQLQVAELAEQMKGKK
jgi:hypothetical protein